MNDTKQIIIGLLWGLFACAIISMCTGCTTTKYIEVPKVHTEYVNRTDTFVQKDSVLIKDSVFVHQKGDTVFVEKIRFAYRDKLRYEVKVDSVLIIDTLTQVIKVEKELTKWQKTKIKSFPYLMCFFIATFGIAFYNVYRKFK